MSEPAEFTPSTPLREGSQAGDTRPDFERGAYPREDLELEPITAEDEDYQSSPPDYQIATYPADFTLEVLHKKWLDQELDIPPFQRGFVWNKTQASKLIESFLVGLPVPAIFLYNERDSHKYLVIDGQQRLRSVFAYFDGHFPPPRSDANAVREQTNGPAFRLTGISPKSAFYRRNFGGLSEPDQRRLTNAVLRAFIVKQLDPDDDTSIYHIFERLNTGGTQLANQEIRNSIYRGEFVELLQHLNRTPDWRLLLGRDTPDSRGRDVELIVRFFATRDLEAYQTPMKRFLSKYMFKHRNASSRALDASSEVFRRTCSAVTSALGERPFHVRKGLNIAVMDSVMVAFSKSLDSVPDDIRARYARLVKNDAFSQNTTQRTTDAERVRERFQLALRTLFDS